MADVSNATNRQCESKKDLRSQPSQAQKISLDCLFDHLHRFYIANFEYEKSRLTSSLAAINKQNSRLKSPQSKLDRSKFMINRNVGTRLISEPARRVCQREGNPEAEDDSLGAQTEHEPERGNDVVQLHRQELRFG